MLQPPIEPHPPDISQPYVQSQQVNQQYPIIQLADNAQQNSQDLGHLEGRCQLSRSSHGKVNVSEHFISLAHYPTNSL